MNVLLKYTQKIPSFTTTNEKLFNSQNKNLKSKKQVSNKHLHIFLYEYFKYHQNIKNIIIAAKLYVFSVWEDYFPMILLHKRSTCKVVFFWITETKNEIVLYIKVYKNVDEEKRERQHKNNKCLHDSTNQNLNNTTTFILLVVVLLFYTIFRTMGSYERLKNKWKSIYHLHKSRQLWCCVWWMWLVNHKIICDHLLSFTIGMWSSIINWSYRLRKMSALFIHPFYPWLNLIDHSLLV